MEVQGRVVLACLPMPPTDNHMYNRGRNGRRFLSDDNKEFRAGVVRWAERHEDRIKDMRMAVQSWRAVEVTVYLGFHHARLWSKKSSPKKLDGTNRLKALLDEVAQLVGVDDSRFWQVTVQKTELPAFEVEHVTVVLDSAHTYDTPVLLTGVWSGDVQR